MNARWRFLQRLIEPVRGLDQAAIALRLLLLGLLLRPIGPWWVRAPLLALSVVGLVDAYVVAFIIVLLYAQVPWAELLLDSFIRCSV